jgi:uncharacterized protein YdhG (YjbR/CyaY superfamily)
MARSKAETVAQYLGQLPAERRAELARVRTVIRKHLPPGYRETVSWGMITYEVPLTRHPKTYNGRPLMYAGLAAQKGYSTLHLMPVYGDVALARRLKEGFKRAGKKLDMGKACIRFHRAEDLALDAVGKAVASTPLKRFVAYAERRGKR